MKYLNLVFKLDGSWPLWACGVIALLAVGATVNGVMNTVDKYNELVALKNQIHNSENCLAEFNTLECHQLKVDRFKLDQKYQETLNAKGPGPSTP